MNLWKRFIRKLSLFAKVKAMIGSSGDPSADSVSSMGFFDGKMEGLLIYRHILTTDEIKMLHETALHDEVNAPGTSSLLNISDHSIDLSHAMDGIRKDIDKLSEQIEKNLFEQKENL